MKLTTKNLIADSLRAIEEEEKGTEIPAGYIEINLSEKGKLGAPKSFHIRNFKMGELLTLSLSDDTSLPRRLISILNDMILEERIDVSNFHEKEVEELMVYIYINFYKNNLEDVVFPIEDSDIKYLEENKPELLQDIKDKKWIPRTNIVIARDTDTYDISEEFNPNITIRNTDTGFYVTFGYVKYGDRLVVKKFLDDFYKDQEIKFARIKNQISLNNSSTNKVPLDPQEEKEYLEYISEKFETLSEVSRIVSVINYNGMDVSDMSLADKYELLSKDARIDYGMISKLASRQSKLLFGIKPNVRMINPFTNQPCERRFSFRIPLIIQALQISGTDKYDDGYTD